MNKWNEKVTRVWHAQALEKAEIIWDPSKCKAIEWQECAEFKKNNIQQQQDGLYIEMKEIKLRGV